MAQRRVTASARLGVELGDGRRALLGLDLDVGVVRGRDGELLDAVLLQGLLVGHAR